MFQGQYVFSQIAEFIPRREFDQCIKRHQGNRRTRNLSCRDQLLTLMFGQLTSLRSLRGIILCLNAHSNLLYHLGFKSNRFTLSTLSRANENRDWKMYHDLAQTLILRARKLYLNDNYFAIDFAGAVYALGSTIIDLCLATLQTILISPRLKSPTFTNTVGRLNYFLNGLNNILKLKSFGADQLTPLRHKSALLFALFCLLPS